MNIQLKNLHTEETRSGFFFDADLCINDKEAGYVTFISGASLTIRANNSEGQALIYAADKYAQTMPPIQLPDKSGKMGKIDMNLEIFVFKTVASYHPQREMMAEKRRQVLCKNKKKLRPRQNHPDRYPDHEYS